MLRIADYIAPALVALLAAGCLDRGDDEPTGEDYDDVAVAVAGLLADDSGGDVTSMEDVTMLAEGEVPVVMTGDVDGTFTGLRGSLSYTYSLACFDAAGTEQAVCDETTDSAQASVAWSGTVDVPRYRADVSRTGSWTISGLQSATAVVDGSGTFSSDSEFTALYNPVATSMSLDYAATYRGVQIDTATRRIVGGSISYDIDAERTTQFGARTGERMITLDAVVTFNGDGTASLVLDGSRSYTVSLDDGSVSN